MNVLPRLQFPTAALSKREIGGKPLRKHPHDIHIWMDSNRWELKQTAVVAAWVSCARQEMERYQPHPPQIRLDEKGILTLHGMKTKSLSIPLCNKVNNT